MGVSTSRVALAAAQVVSRCSSLHVPDVVETLARAPAGNPVNAERTGPLQPDNAVYVIYTSGSTGSSKGVVVSHQNVVRLFRSISRWFAFGPHDVWTLFHSYAFDFSVWELWGPFLFGGRLVSRAQDGHSLADGVSHPLGRA